MLEPDSANGAAFIVCSERAINIKGLISILCHAVIEILMGCWCGAGVLTSRFDNIYVMP